MGMIDLSVVIVNWNAKEPLKRCLESVYEETTGTTFEIFVVDNASGDGSSQMVRHSFPQVKLVENEENVGFARACNRGLCRAQGRYVVLFNPDTWLPDDALGQMVAFLDKHPNVGVLGPRIVDRDGIVDPRCARRYPSLRSELFEKLRLDRRFPHSRLFGDYLMTYWDHKDPRDVDALSGACMVIRREALDQVGLLDEDFFMYSEDTELCFRLKQAGWRVVYWPAARVRHWGGYSTSRVRDAMGVEALRSTNRLFRKCYGTIPAMAHRLMVATVTVGKLIAFAAGWLAARNAGQRARFAHKLALHRRVLRWALGGD
jgi:GT2 family glycosyltransferase